MLKSIFQPTDRAKKWRIFIFVIFLAAGGLIIDSGAAYNKLAAKIEEKTSISLPEAKEIDFRLGLDLLGGAHLVYEADMAEIPEADRNSALEGARDVIERRVNVFGVSEPLVQTSRSGENYRLIVELAGIDDVNEAIKMIGETPLLEFRKPGGEARELAEEEKRFLAEFNQKAEEKAEEALGKILSGGDFKAIAAEYSQDPAAKEPGGELGWITEKNYPEIIEQIKDLEIGQASTELTKTDKGYAIFKLNDKRVKTNPFDANKKETEVKASHILICYSESELCELETSRDEAYQKIKELKAEATPKNFIDLAKKHSTEPGAAVTGGSLGWFGRGAMVKPFEETVFDNQATGEISYIVETKFGFHLIYKEDQRDILEYNASQIAIPTISAADLVGAQANWENTELTGKYLKRATVSFNPNDNSPEVSLEFDKEGADLFARITEENIGRQIAVFLDGLVISAPSVNEKISGGRAVITGSFNIKEAKLLAQRLNAGALPVPINLANQKTVGATLGQESVEASLQAGIIGLVLVAIFMILYYRLPGILAVVSLLIYGILVLAIFKIWPVTLTLSGLAGFILSIGMAVDANILIFERLKEELKLGAPLKLSIEEGFKRAWPSIRDGNISTLITCFILIQFTTSLVKGFALTLGLGVIISMFSAVVITRNLLKIFGTDRLEKYKWLWN